MPLGSLQQRQLCYGDQNLNVFLPCAQGLKGRVEEEPTSRKKLEPFCLKLAIKTDTGLTLRAGGWGFPLATMNVAPGYFHRKIEEK